jgi:pimeloyl-ACP methyl ester carboxylesterase
MPETLNLNIDVTGSCALPGPLHIASTVFLPDPKALSSPPIAIFASPGASYSRGYFDLHFKNHPHYSQAEHHANRGIIVVTYDHLGVGGSSTQGLIEMTVEMIAAANDAAVRKIIDRLQCGTLKPQFPALPDLVSIGIGQSMGGMVTAVMQGSYGTFAAIALLGASAIRGIIPQPDPKDQEKANEYMRNFTRKTPVKDLSLSKLAAPVLDIRYPFHWEDMPEDIVKADLDGGCPMRKEVPPWGSGTIPACVAAMPSPGYISEDAAKVTVPVLIGVGERDTMGNPLAEPAAFSRSRDISVFITPRMAHMHNFATTRRLLWDRIEAFARRAATTPGSI